MFIRCEESAQPGILVEEGTTFTLTAQESREFPTLLTHLRPRTTAGLLLAAGRPVAKPIRLSDTSEFEAVRAREDLVDLHAIDAEERVGGYSVNFLSRVFDALDPESRMPPATVEFRPKRREKKSGCSCQHELAQPAVSAAAQADQAMSSGERLRSRIVAPVPRFVSELKVRLIAPLLSDIVVKPNATLVLDASVRHLMARNVYCYYGSRIVQKSGRLNMDITGVFRGSIPNYVIFYTAADILKIRAVDLQQVVATNP